MKRAALRLTQRLIAILVTTAAFVALAFWVAMGLGSKVTHTVEGELNLRRCLRRGWPRSAS